MILNGFYNLLFLLALLFALPKMGWQQLRSGKYRGTWGERFGLRPPHLPPKQKKRIWIHAVSMGETRALIPLLPHLLQEGDTEVLISSTTTTGHLEAKRSLPQAIAHFYLPFDLSWIMRKYIRHIQPDLLLLCESDFWYQLTSQVKRAGVPIALINGKISERSASRFRRLPHLTCQLFKAIDLFCVQNTDYAHRFLSLGIPLKKITVTGNLKFDVAPPVLTPLEKKAWQERLGLLPSDRIVVIGSSHATEEAMLLNALKPLWKHLPDLKVILVPRHPERFKEVEEYLQREGWDASCVILINVMGLLNTCYQLAEVAIVAGSFIPSVGGHNIFEPIYFHVPVLFGPHMHTQVELTEVVLRSQAGQQVSLEQLPSVLLDLLQNFKVYESMAHAGLKLAEQMRGASLRTYQCLKAQEMSHAQCPRPVCHHPLI